jgi:hypothetical protein
MSLDGSLTAGTIVDQTLRQRVLDPNISLVDAYVYSIKLGAEEEATEFGLLVRIVKLEERETYTRKKPYTCVWFQSYGGKYKFVVNYWLYRTWFSQRMHSLKLVSNMLDKDTWFWMKPVAKTSSGGGKFFDYEFKEPV